MAKQMGLMGLGCFIFMMVALQINGAAAATYQVGDSLGWTVPPNTSFYTNWSSSKNFQIGDSAGKHSFYYLFSLFYFFLKLKSFLSLALSWIVTKHNYIGKLYIYIYI